MASNIFISFRFSDGHRYKEKLSSLLDRNKYTVDFSEDEDRSSMSEQTIQRYLYSKLRRSSVTIVIITPNAVNHRKNVWNRYDDWMYDEIRYSLENRGYNKSNALIAVYTPEAENQLISRTDTGTKIIADVDNLFRKNMMNVKDAYKKNPEYGIYDSNFDSYCSLISWNDFTSDIAKYVDIALEKRENIWKYNICKRL